MARVAWGLEAGDVSRARGFIRVAHDAQAGFRHHGRDLGPVSLGVLNRRIHARTTDANSSRIYLDGFDENLTVYHAYLSMVVPGSSAIDVGANIGTHSLVLAALGARVWAYEPDPNLASRLRENLELNNSPPVTFRECGLGSVEGTFPFQSSFSDFNVGQGRFGSAGSASLPVTTLDRDYRASARVSVLKIDVEGMELEVLRGAQQLLAEHRPSLIIEWNWPLRDLLELLPYRATVQTIPGTLYDRSRTLTLSSPIQPSTNLRVTPKESSTIFPR